MRLLEMLAMIAALATVSTAHATVTRIDLMGDGTADALFPLNGSVYNLVAASGSATLPALTLTPGDTIEGTVSFSSPVTLPGAASAFGGIVSLYGNLLVGFDYQETFRYLQAGVDVTPPATFPFNGSFGQLAAGDVVVVATRPVVFDAIDYSLTVSRIYQYRGFGVPDRSAPELQTVALDAGTPFFATFITSVSPAVPEVSTWILLVTGMALIGVGVRRRRQAVPA